MNVLFIKENRTLNVRFRIQLLDFARTSIPSWSCHQDGRSEDKVRLRLCFVQSNYSGSWTEPVCVLHRICGHETEDDKKNHRFCAFIQFICNYFWMKYTPKKFLSFQRMWKSVFSRRWLLQYFLDWTKHLVYHVQCIRGKKNNKMHLHKILILKFLMLSFVPI